MKRSVVLLSGGLDSTLCLFWAIARGEDEGTPVSVVAFDYGQTHGIEVKRSRLIARLNDVPWDFLTLYDTVDSDETFAPLEPGAVMPARNAIFLSSAASWATMMYPGDSIRLVVGACQEDQKGFPDCRPAFFRAMQKAFHASELPVSIDHPLLGLTKGEAIRQTLHDVQKRGGWHGVRHLKECLYYSWSCYDPQDGDPCGKCGACRFRADGFKAAGLEDPAL